MNGSTHVLAIAGDLSLFGLRAVTDACRRPFEVAQIRRQVAEVGSKSLPLLVRPVLRWERFYANGGVPADQLRLSAAVPWRSGNTFSGGSS